MGSIGCVRLRLSAGPIGPAVVAGPAVLPGPIVPGPTVPVLAHVTSGAVGNAPHTAIPRA